MSSLYEFGACRVDVGNRVFTRAGEVVRLPPKTFDLLVVLLESRGRAVSKNELMQSLWPDTFVEEANLSFQISALRKAFGEDGAEWVETLPKHGYRFVAPIVETNIKRVAGRPDSLIHWVWPALAAALALVAVVTSWIAWRAKQPVDHLLLRLNVDLGTDALIGTNLTVAISPDGRRVVFPWRGPIGRQQLATRLLDLEQLTPLPGTENGASPFFSRDGRWVGYFADGKLKKISVEGGAPETLCSAPAPAGASWGEDGNIVLSLNTLGPLSRVPAGGGTPQPLTSLRAGQNTHRWPQILPDGEHVLFTASVTSSFLDNADVEVASLKTGEAKVVQRGGYYGRYLPSGHLIYVHQGALFGVRFDARRLEIQGTPIPLLENLAVNPFTGGGQFDFSAAPSGAGTFVYLAGPATAQSWRVSWLDGSGMLRPLIAEPGFYPAPRFSPDGRRLAFGGSGSGGVYDLERETNTRIALSGNAASVVPVWTPDGRHIVFNAFTSASGRYGLFRTRSDGAGEPLRLLESRDFLVPYSISPDGRWLVYFEHSDETGWDIWILPLDAADPDHPKPTSPQPLLRTRANERDPRFSPDGHWFAYRSDESGSDEIYVRPFPAGTQGKWQISAGGGLYAFWSNNGRELFYESADNRIKVVEYNIDGDSFVPGRPRLWTDRQIFYSGVSNLDLAPDGKRFAVLAQPEAASRENSSVHVTMLFNWFDEVRRRLPAHGR